MALLSTLHRLMRLNTRCILMFRSFELLLESLHICVWRFCLFLTCFESLQHLLVVVVLSCPLIRVCIKAWSKY